MFGQALGTQLGGYVRLGLSRQPSHLLPIDSQLPNLLFRLQNLFFCWFSAALLDSVLDLDIITLQARRLHHLFES
jgi:hypothetical protein